MGSRRTEGVRMDREATSNKSLDISTVTSWVRGRGVYVAFVVLAIFNLIVTPNFASVATLSTLLITVSPIVLVSLGVALAIGTEGIDLSVGSVMALASAFLPLYLGYGWLVGLSVALLVGALAGLVNGSLVAFVGVQPIIATLAMLVGGRGLAQIFAGGQSLLVTDPVILWLRQGRGGHRGQPLGELFVGSSGAQDAPRGVRYQRALGRPGRGRSHGATGGQ